MKLLFIISGLLMSMSLQAQTKLIAYKSHSGSLEFFVPDIQPEDDFGLPPQRIIQIEKINDSTIVETSDFFREGSIFTDTVIHHPYFRDTTKKLEDIQKMYPPKTKFKGFKRPQQKSKKPIKTLKNKAAVNPKKPRFCPTDSLRERAIISTYTEPPSPNGKDYRGFWTLLSLYLLLTGYIGYKALSQKLSAST